MDSLKQTLLDMTEAFNARMADFEKNTNNTSASATTDGISSEFFMFRSFVMSSLKTLHTQVDLLFKICDHQETYTRRKMLLVHGVAEEGKEDTASVLASVITKKLNMPDINVDCFSRCHRLGRPNPDKARPIVVKFHSGPVRNQVWFSKTSLKQTGITISEFLTKARHDTFMAARKRFGIARCWTQDGTIIIRTPDGSRRRVVCIEDLDGIPSDIEQQQTNTNKGCTNTKATAVSRPRRNLKK